MILFIVELFAKVKRFGFYIKLSSGDLNIWYIFWIISNSFFDFLKETKEKKKKTNGKSF